MSLSVEDKKWLVRLVQLAVYLICTHYAYPGKHKPSKRALKYEFEEFLK